MNDKKAYNESKRFDSKLVDRLVSNGFTQSRLATTDEDKGEFWDVLIKNDSLECRVDTKYPKVKVNDDGSREVWVEFSKLTGVKPGKADEIWYIFKDRGSWHYIFMEKDALRDLLVKMHEAGDLLLQESNNSRSGKNPGDMIGWVPVDRLEQINIFKSRERWIQKTK